MNFNLDKKQHINRMKPLVDKLVNDLQVNGISFKEMDDDIENVIFEYNGKQCKISHHLFYRWSGMSHIQSITDKHTFKFIPIKDEMFLFNYIKPMIENYFGLNS